MVAYRVAHLEALSHSTSSIKKSILQLSERPSVSPPPQLVRRRDFVDHFGECICCKRLSELDHSYVEQFVEVLFYARKVSTRSRRTQRLGLGDTADVLGLEAGVMC